MPIFQIFRKYRFNSWFFITQNYTWFTHQKHWEIISLFFICLFKVIKNITERFKIFFVNSCLITVSRNVDTIYFLKLCYYLFFWFMIANRNYSNTRLFQEWNMSFWNIRNDFALVFIISVCSNFFKKIIFDKLLGLFFILNKNFFDNVPFQRLC